MSSMGFDPTIPAIERVKTFYALDRATTVIGKLRDSSVGIATGYGLDVQGFESRQEEDFLFSIRPDQFLCPPIFLSNEYWGRFP
jgi:hypothetical protein